MTMPAIQIDEVVAEVAEQPAATPETQSNATRQPEPPTLADVMRNLRRIQRRAERLEARY
jgi:hypothetical protein